jgi:hypothetical protein
MNTTTSNQPVRPKPRHNNSVFYKSSEGWVDYGYITETENNGIVHVGRLDGSTDTFIWIFNEGLATEHTNQFFKWGQECVHIDCVA